MSEFDQVTVIIPCRNEAGSLPGLLAAVPDGYLALVVDNGSEDDTADVARRHGAEVAYEPIPGYGSAVQAGVEASSTPVLCVIDGDGSMDPGELPRLVRLVQEGADLAVGRRRPVRRSGWPLHARAGNALVAARLRHHYGLPVHDLGAARAAKRRVLVELGIQDRRSGYPLELLIRAARANLRIEEADITYRPRTAGKSKVSGSILGSLQAAWDFGRVIR
ncbi:MAG: glycosyltransferase [Acidimicrobiales bacterium]